MKSYRRFLAAAAAVMMLCLLLLAVQTGRSGQTQRDTVLLNDIVYSVRAHLANPEELGSLDFGTAFLVFDSSGGLLYASPDAPADIQSASDALGRGWLCLAVTEAERYRGSVALPDPALDSYSAMRRGLLLAAAIASAILFLLLLGIGLYLHRCVIAPFRRMRRFADNIAQGRLDEPLMMEQTNLFGSFTESFDIMRTELLEARRREDAARLREKELAAALSHDIKTPVTGIKLICELLSVKTDDPYILGKTAAISEKAEQIHVLANDLLTSALEELGEMQVHCQEVSAAVLHSTVAEHDPRGLAAEDPVPECLLYADTGRLSQVIGNVISNSYKYAGTPIRVQYAFAEGFLRMEISDAGGGIPEEEIAHITTKFYRGKANSGGKEGSGLGLYISSELMRRMGGQLLCENRGGGLTVTLMIRLA